MDAKKKSALKRALGVTLIIMGGLVLLAVILGVLNALVADGKWSFGWTNYRYDDTGYEIGGGTLPYSEIECVEVDWIDGEVTVTVCDDRYPSLTEEAEGELAESVTVHWRVSEDGKTLSVKYRESSYYFAGNERNKKLTLRLPREMAEGLQSLEICTASANVMVKGIQAAELDFECASGNLIAEACVFQDFDAQNASGSVVCNSTVTGHFDAETVSGTVVLMTRTCPAETDIETVSGDIRLSLPEDAGMTLLWETVSGSFSMGKFAFEQQGGVYICGGGEHELDIQTVSGGLSFEELEE